MISIRLTMIGRLWLLLDWSACSLCSITCSLPECYTTEYIPSKTRVGGDRLLDDAVLDEVKGLGAVKKPVYVI